MKRLSTSLLIFILALLAVPDRAWAWTSVEFHSSLDKWAIGHTMTKKSANSFSYEVTASEDFNFRFYVSDDNGLWLRSYETSSNTVSNYDGSVPYWCSNSGNTDITFKVDQRYTKYRIDLTFDNTGGDGNKYFKFTVTGVTEGGSSDPVSTYKLMKGDGTNKEGTQVATFTGAGFPYTATYNIDAAGEYYFYVNDGAKNYFNTNQEITTDGGYATIYRYNDNYFDRVVKLQAPRAGEYTFKFNHVANTESEYTLQCYFPSDTEAKYTVKISAGEGGSVDPSGDQQIGSTPVNITANPNSGYEFVKWIASEGVTVDNASSATTTVRATKDGGTLKANFKAKGSTSAPQVEKVKLYVKNAAGWTGDMYAYVFKSSTEHNAAYPGVKMTSVTGNDYDFEYTVPEGYENGYVIFSAGSNRFPADKRSGFGIRNASHIFNNEHNTWIAPQSSTIEGKNSITIYAYINDDKAWYPTDKGDGNDGDINIGTNFYIFAYTNASKSEYHAYDPDNGDKKLTTNDYNPGYGKTAGTAYNDYGDYCDETVYPVKYGSISTDLRYAKFVIHYDKELEGQTAFYTLNSGSLGTGQASNSGNYQIRQLFKDGKNNLGDSYKGKPYYYELPSVTLANGTSYSFRLGYQGYFHQSSSNNGINFENYKIEDVTSETVAGNIFPTVTLDDDYGCIKGQDNSNGTFFSDEEKTNIWDKASTYNVNMYRPFYSDGVYETICLPFDVPASEVSEKFGTDTKLYKVTAASETDITFTEQKGADCYIEAGVPYIILPQLKDVTGSNWTACGDNGTVITFAAKEMKYAYNEESQQKALSYTDKDDIGQSLTMKGCFIPHLIGEADRFFNTTADNKNVFYQQAYNDRRVIRGTRVFFNDTKDPEVTVSVGGQQVSAKSIILDSEDEPIVTGLYAPETGKIEVLKDTRVFSISGQYVGTSLNGLSKGIYVVNGKKVVIK